MFIVLPSKQNAYAYNCMYSTFAWKKNQSFSFTLIENLLAKLFEHWFFLVFFGIFALNDILCYF